MKKHIKEIFFWLLVPILIVLAILVLVVVFERLDIHVPGNREMWIGLMGSVIGGAFTMLGVLVTLFKQEEVEAEKVRFDNMPILIFDTYYNSEEPESLITVLNNELCTSGFLPVLSKCFVTFRVSTLNKNSIFNFTIEGCAINGKVIPTGDFFFPTRRRIVIGEYATLAFGLDNTTTNILCVLRFSYEDILGNKYYQDLPFTYVETLVDGDVPINKQVIEIRDIQSPILATKKAKSLEVACKEHKDYDTFYGKVY